MNCNNGIKKNVTTLSNSNFHKEHGPEPNQKLKVFCKGIECKNRM